MEEKVIHLVMMDWKKKFSGPYTTVLSAWDTLDEARAEQRRVVKEEIGHKEYVEEWQKVVWIHSVVLNKPNTLEGR